MEAPPGLESIPRRRRFRPALPLTLVLAGIAVVGAALLLQCETKPYEEQALVAEQTKSVEPHVRERPQDGPARVATTSIEFQGNPRGGTIEFFVFNTTLTIFTSPDDSVAAVAQKVGAAVNDDSTLAKQGITAQITGNLVTLWFPEYQLSLCTTDEGLKVTQKPQQLACTVEDDIIVFTWQNPTNGYDRIHIVEGAIPIAEDLPGTQTSFVHHYLDPDALPRGLIYQGRHRYRILGVKDQIPSCAAVCEVHLNQR